MKSKNTIRKKVREILSCPHCMENLLERDTSFHCCGCGRKYETNKKNQINIKPQKKIKKKFKYEINKKKKNDVFENIMSKTNNINCKVEDDEPWGDARSIVSHLPEAENDDSILIEIGVIKERLKSIVERKGYKYVSLDYDSNSCDILADGHALPFETCSVDIVIANKTLEHVRNPFIVVNEIYRVLAKGGFFIGSVAFLEPFHESYFHSTHKGVYTLLSQAGFNVQKVYPDRPGIYALSSMALFKRVPYSITKNCFSIIEGLSKAYYWLGRKIVGSKFSAEKYRKLITAGGFIFSANKK